MPELSQSTWIDLGGAVDSGELLLDGNAAARCAQHCRDLVGKLEGLRNEVFWLGAVKGMGTFPSGIALAEKFSKKAVGGSYSMVDALADHIAEVQAMQAVFEKIQARYGATEQSNADFLRGIPDGS